MYFLICHGNVSLCHWCYSIVWTVLLSYKPPIISLSLFSPLSFTKLCPVSLVILATSLSLFLFIFIFVFLILATISSAVLATPLVLILSFLFHDCRCRTGRYHLPFSCFLFLDQTCLFFKRFPLHQDKLSQINLASSWLPKAQTFLQATPALSSKLHLFHSTDYTPRANHVNCPPLSLQLHLFHSTDYTPRAHHVNCCFLQAHTFPQASRAFKDLPIRVCVLRPTSHTRAFLRVPSAYGSRQVCFLSYWVEQHHGRPYSRTKKTTPPNSAQRPPTYTVKATSTTSRYVRGGHTWKTRSTNN